MAGGCEFRPTLGTGRINRLDTVLTASFKLPNIRAFGAQSILPERRAIGAASAILPEEPWVHDRCVLSDIIFVNRDGVNGGPGC